MWMLLSARPPATNLPSGLKATACTAAGRFGNCFTTLASAVVHTVSDLSAPPAATLAPLPPNATHSTASVLPGKGRSAAPVARFHSRACLSAQPVSSLVPSGLSTAAVTLSGWANSFGGAAGSCHTLRPPSADADSELQTIGIEG